MTTVSGRRFSSALERHSLRGLLGGRRASGGVIAGLLLVALLAGTAVAGSPDLGIAPAVALLVWTVVRNRPMLIVYGLTVALPLLGGLERGGVVPVLRVGQAVLIVGFVLFLCSRSGTLGKTRLTAIDFAFALFLITEAVLPLLALYARGDQLDLGETNNLFGVSPLQTMLGPIQYYLLYRIVVSSVSSERHVGRIVELMLSTSILVALIGIVEKASAPFRRLVEIYYPPIATPSGYQIADVNQRIASTLQHYAGLGAYLTFTLLIVVACYSTTTRYRVSPLLLQLALIVDSVALLLTGTFAAWIGLPLGCVAIVVLARRFPGVRTMLFMLLGFGLASVAFGSFLSARLDQQLGPSAMQGFLPQSLAFRITLWHQIFFPAIGHNLFFGAGPAPSVLAEWPTEESQYILLLLRGGILYLLSYLLLIGIALRGAWRLARNGATEGSIVRPLSIATMAILIAMTCMNVVGEFFTYVGGTQVLWTAIALMTAGQQLNARPLPIANEKE